MATFKTIKSAWDLTPLFTGDDDPQIDINKKETEEAVKKFITKWQKRDDYLKDPAILKEALDEYNELQANYSTVGKFGYYFGLRSILDQIDPKLKAKSNQVDEFSLMLANELQFFSLKVAKIPLEEQEKFLTFEALSPYKHYLERSFAESKYLLSDAEEKIMNLKSMPAHHNWVQMTSTFLSKEERTVLTEDEKEETVSFSMLYSLISSKKKNVRDKAVNEFHDINRKYAEVAENEFNAILLDKKINDTLRGVKRPDETRHVSDDIETVIVDTLTEAVSSKFDIPKKYYELKAKLMGVEKLAYHERNVEFGEVSKKYSYEESAELIYEVFSQLDGEFAAIFKQFVENGNIDAFPKKGKRQGAACWHYLYTQPTYLFLNHTDQLNDVLTFAHELGHGINNELIRKTQNALNFDTPLSTAEVASTFMEDFVLQRLLQDADDELRLTLLMQKINDDISTIFRQIAAYKFEQELHQIYREKGYLPKEEIGQIFLKHMASYMGDFVSQDPGSENWWVYWQHFRTFFYVYSYASGLLISKSLQAIVKKDPNNIEKVKQFLSAGTSDSPKNIFMKIGIDISQKTFWDQGLEEIQQLLEETENLAKKLNKI